MRSVVGLAVVVAAALIAVSAAQGATPATVEEEHRAIAELMARAEKLPVKTLDARAQALIAARPFAELPPVEQCAVYLVAGAAKAQLDDPIQADALLAHAACAPVDKDFWSLRLSVGLRANNPDSAVEALQQLALHWPAAIGEFDDETVLRTIHRAHDLPDGRRRQLDLLDAIGDGGWTPKDPAFRLDYLWAILAASLADDGHASRAAVVAQRITHPLTLAAMRADKRFDGLFDHAAPRYDPEAAWAGELEMWRKLVADHPNRLSYLNDYAFELTATGHAETALRLLDDALARAAKAPRGKPAFSDEAEKLLWIKDTRARALFELGRTEEATAVWVAASAEKENGGPNVSQAINLGGLYVRLGRPQDALRSVERMVGDVASPYGLMQAEEVRAAAYARLGDKARLAQSLAYIRAHEADAPRVLVDALVGSGDLDGAAAVYIRRLADPDTRLRALDELQDYAPSLTQTPVTQADQAHWKALKARPDMQAAIAKVGRINRYSFMQEPG